MKRKLLDIADVIMGQSPKSEFYNSTGEGLPFLQGSRTFGSRFPIFDTYTTSPTRIAKAGDIIMSVRAPVGDLNIAPEDLCLGRGVCAVRMKNGNQDFLFYLLRYSMPHLINRESGTVFGSVNRNDIGSLIVDIPDDKKQRKIARFLTMLDDKIALNEAINHNLEDEATLIFTHELLLFDSLPHGWQIASLAEIADYLNGLAMQKHRPREGESGLPVLKIKELRQRSCDTSSDLCSPRIRKEYIIEDGDVIFSWSGSLLVDFWCGGKCGLNQHLFKVSSLAYDKWFYYSWLKFHLNKFIAVAKDMATTMGHIKREELEKTKVLIPSPNDYARISKLLSPIYDLAITTRLENRKLIQLRENLLPLLMTGELDISRLEY